MAYLVGKQYIPVVRVLESEKEREGTMINFPIFKGW
jgi:hypothetical protein